MCSTATVLPASVLYGSKVCCCIFALAYMTLVVVTQTLSSPSLQEGPMPGIECYIKLADSGNLHS